MTKQNFYVAAANMVSTKMKLDVERIYHEAFVNTDVEASQVSFYSFCSTQHLRKCNAHACMVCAQDWRAMYTATRNATDDFFLQRALHWAQADREKYSGGGCLVVAEDEAHVARLLDMWEELGGDVKAGPASALQDKSYGVVIVPKRASRGYTAVRLGALVRMPYPGSPAERKQMEGRLWRLTQTRPRVHLETVFAKDSLQEHLHKNHNLAANTALSLETLAKEYLQKHEL